MDEQQLANELDDIGKGIKMFDTVLHFDYSKQTATLNEKQASLVRRLFKLFKNLKWQVKFNTFKQIKYDSTPALTKGALCPKIGSPVKIRSCREEHGDKTYFGIYIGSVAQGISHSINGDVVKAAFSSHNPGFLIPELGDVIYGCESWWSEIKSEQELSELITDDVIKNVLYVKMLRGMRDED